MAFALPTELQSPQPRGMGVRGSAAGPWLGVQVQDGYERIERIKKLTAKLQGREPHAFTDVLVTMLQTLDEATLADDAVLRQCDVARQETFDLKEVAARPVHTLKVKATVRCMCRDPELPEQVRRVPGVSCPVWRASSGGNCYVPRARWPLRWDYGALKHTAVAVVRSSPSASSHTIFCGG